MRCTFTVYRWLGKCMRWWFVKRVWQPISFYESHSTSCIGSITKCHSKFDDDNDWMRYNNDYWNHKLLIVSHRRWCTKSSGAAAIPSVLHGTKIPMSASSMAFLVLNWYMWLRRKYFFGETYFSRWHNSDTVLSCIRISPVAQTTLTRIRSSRPHDDPHIVLIDEPQSFRHIIVITPHHFITIVIHRRASSLSLCIILIHEIHVHQPSTTAIIIAFTINLTTNNYHDCHGHKHQQTCFPVTGNASYFLHQK